MGTVSVRRIGFERLAFASSLNPRAGFLVTHAKRGEVVSYVPLSIQILNHSHKLPVTQLKTVLLMRGAV